MKHSFTLWEGLWRRVALLALVLLAAISLRPGTVKASHIRAGDIQAKIDTTLNFNARRVFFKLTLYIDPRPAVPQEAETIFFGDGTSSCYKTIPRSSVRLVPGSTDTEVHTYYFEHIYGSTGQYTVEFIGENRVTGVLNMANSSSQTFYLRTTITIDPALGRNHSAVLTAPAIDKAGLRQVFQHNPGGFDADGDSLAYKLVPCQQVLAGVINTLGPPCTGPNTGNGNNNPVPVNCTNFRLPNAPDITSTTPRQVDFYNQYGVQTGFAGQPATFSQDVVSGMITWNASEAIGYYNVAFVVEEWRRYPGQKRRQIGEVVRDMQIIVSATNNLPPTLTIPADICVEAGQQVRGIVTATDGVGPGSTPATPVALFAYAGIRPPATFTQSQAGPPQATGTFTWQTDCSNVANQPYQVVFKAQDTPPPQATYPPLVDIKVWRITVVGPAPQGLRATPLAGANGAPNRVRLTWTRYQCANAAQMYVYRKINPSTWGPTTCETGIPPRAGYVRLGPVPIDSTGYTDLGTVGGGLERGQTYCYRIYAEFPLPAGGASIASAEACAMLPGASARLVKVDVLSTQANTGQIQVCWTQPRAAPGYPLDGTLRYVLSRAEGLNPAAGAFAPIATIASLTDTCYTDVSLNTQDRQYTYKLDFTRTFPPSGGATITETAPLASSVRLSAVPDRTATAINLSWAHSVPWDNTVRPTEVYRRIAGVFVRIGTASSTATGGTYTDNGPGLVKGETYCYYVRTEGQYQGIAYLTSLLNRSQERCVSLTTPPCTPVLSLQVTNCDSLAGLPSFPGLNQRYTNRLRWAVGNTPAGCEGAVAGYRVYYRPGPTGAFALLGTTNQARYEHANLLFSGGCYAVQAVAGSGAVSDTSNVACQDNCVFFSLPNIFTPNGDGANDQFRPKTNSPVRRVHFQAYNRWGVKVFENTTTADDSILINWTAVTSTSDLGANKKVADGIYFYLVEVEFADFANTRRTYKGWVEVMR